MLKFWINKFDKIKNSVLEETLTKIKNNFEIDSTNC